MRLHLYSFLLFLPCCIFISNKAYAQSTYGEIKGIIQDRETGEKIIGASVFVKELKRGTNSDFDGFYTITSVPAGSYTLLIRYVGYDSLVEKITIASGEMISKNFYLYEKSTTLSTAEVVGKREDKSKVPNVGKSTIKPEEIKIMPSIGAPDLAQYLQVLPGVVFTGDQGGQLYIRGGSPVMNKVLLDGMTIYNPFHSIGLFSVFDSDLIKTAEVYSAGFGAEYGGRISAIVDVKTRDGNRNRMAGSINTNPFMSKILIEGPLKKFQPGEGASSFAVSIKNSYLEKSAPIFYPYINPDILPYRFNDIYAKASYNSSNGSGINGFLFNFDDRVTFPKSTSYHWKSNGFGSRFVLIPENSNVKIDGYTAYSDYSISQQEFEETNPKPRTSEIKTGNFGMNFINYFEKDELKYGLDINVFSTDFELFNSNNRRITQFNDNAELSSYFTYRMVRKRFLFDAGFRVQLYSTINEYTFEPRLSGKYNVNRYFRIKAAAGLYSQNLMSAFSDRDVVNLFYGFLSSPSNLPRTFDDKDVTHRLQKSQHLVAGLEFDPIDKLEINIEGFYKYFPQLTNINRDKIFEDIPDFSDKPDRLKKDFVIENGNAYGGDISLKYQPKKLFLWAVYSITWVNRFDGEIVYPTIWDRRHNANFLMAYTPDKKESWTLSVRWNLGSGFPFTQSEGYYEKIDFQQQGISTPHLQRNGSLGIVFGDLNGGRLPYFHRLDVSVEKIWYKTKRSKLWSVLSVTNVYNRNNVFYFDRVSFSRIDQLPVMPSISLNASF
jgi:hypothetical protein